MKLKLLLIIVGATVIGSSVTVVVIQSKDRAAHRKTKRQKPESADRLRNTMSNYKQTFKLNTPPPLWPDATTNRRSYDSSNNRTATDKR
jgi:hypothetical protein